MIQNTFESRQLCWKGIHISPASSFPENIALTLIQDLFKLPFRDTIFRDIMNQKKIGIWHRSSYHDRRWSVWGWEKAFSRHAHDKLYTYLEHTTIEDQLSENRVQEVILPCSYPPNHRSSPDEKSGHENLLERYKPTSSSIKSYPYMQYIWQCPSLHSQQEQ